MPPLRAKHPPRQVDAVLAALVERLPCPQGTLDAPLKALLVDSRYDSYLGVVVLVRVHDGILRKGQKVRFMATGTSPLNFL